MNDASIHPTGRQDPAQTLRNRSLLTLEDFSPAEISHLLALSLRLKAERRGPATPGTTSDPPARLRGRTLAIVFEKLSTRTRCAFETAFAEEGGHPVFLGADDIHLGVKESVEDSARVFGRMFDAIAFRGFRQSTVETLAKLSGVPVYNGLTDESHPTQALADIMTLQEAFGTPQAATLCFVGDGRNNVARSLLVACAKLGVHMRLAAPPELQPPAAFIERVHAIARAAQPQAPATVDVFDDPFAAVRDVDAVYTDVWASMGEESQAEQRRQQLQPFQVTARLMAATNRSSTIFLHCLPANKGQEVTEDVFESTQSRVFDQAENRKHTIKALMLATLGAAPPAPRS